MDGATKDWRLSTGESKWPVASSCGAKLCGRAVGVLPCGCVYGSADCDGVGAC
jgi:sulfite exporter TauE/SafE